MSRCLSSVESALKSLSYHSYTLWLFVFSDFKTIVAPSTIFGITNAWAASKYDPHVPGALYPPKTISDSPKSIGRALAALSWLLVNLIPFAINNQRGQRAIAEDGLNKPWRPFPRGRISHEWGTRVMVTLYILAPIYSLAFAGGVRHSVALIWLGVWYNNWGGADKNPVIRNIINGLGYTCFASGAMEVALGGSLLSLHPLGWLGRWLLVITGIIFSTVQLQDMSDQPGDAKRGRRTVPLYGIGFTGGLEDSDDQTVLITGANVGLGLEAARHITRLGAARVILGVRNVAAGKEAKENIEKSTGRLGVCEVWEVDLASHASVLAFGERISKLPKLDAAILNAALATEEYNSVEGYERTITVNVINTLLLGLLLLPTLKATRQKNPSHTPRLSFVVSEVHGWVDFTEWKEDEPMKVLSDQTKAKMGERYPLSKLLEVLLVQELAGRVRGSEVIINMLNPGLCHSQLGRESDWKLTLMKMLLARSTEVGSRTLVAGASAGLESHGAYMHDGYVENTSLSSFVRSDEGRQAREKLWAELSSILEGVYPGVMQNV
ncbi:Short-chain dehydrogenase/reductase SDR [Penicillium italicum]|uniref:Short-chain dehydrogenase/reductase SDR n=1 Tax=Penicillium italicum TaxID=40296 RepID=A0A0A2LAC0_PENIT|nr:Short-chain dehydrogenase/reductase SDR [Penicillium italicum]